MQRLVIAAAITAMLSACGSDGLVEGDYLGDPLITFDGTFEGFINGQTKPVAPAIAVIWAIRDGQPGTAAWSFERISSVSPVASSSFPWNYTFSVYDLPPEGVIKWIRWDTAADPIGLAPGLIVAFDDVNQDGKLEFEDPTDPNNARILAPDHALGAARNNLLLFADYDFPEGATVRNFPLPGPPEPGYQLLQTECGQVVGVVRGETPTVVVQLAGPQPTVPDPDECPPPS